MKRILKITIILIVLIIISGNMNYIYATHGTSSLEIPDGGSGSISSIPEWSNTLDDYWNPSAPKRGSINTQEINEKAIVIISVVRNIGLIVSVAVLIIIGIKNITASAEERSVIKAAMPGYLIGAALIAAITYLPTVIYNIVQHIK